MTKTKLSILLLSILLSSCGGGDPEEPQTPSEQLSPAVTIPPTPAASKSL